MLKDLMQDRPISYLMTFLCIFKNVTDKNLKQVYNLVNRNVRFVEEIPYDVNETSISSLPIYVLANFGETYTGQSFFPNDS